mgnify:CR=1 FL=1
MPREKDYSKGKIYFILSNNPDITVKYVGSTIQTLAQRMNGHRAGYKRWLEKKENPCAIFHEFKEHGIEQFHIELIEDYPCEREEQLLARENFFIRKEDCVNKISAILTPEERKEYKKKYKQEHIDKYKHYFSNYREQHREEAKTYAKQYYQNNTEKALQYRKEYVKINKEKIKQIQQKKYLKNAEAISIKNKELVTCVCGVEIQKCSLTRHLKTEKHKSIIAEKT